jgi:flagellar basal-body rod protein FlgB
MDTLKTGVHMGLDLDTYFGIHAKALSLRDQRASQLAMNITNADTPHYKAKDMDFQAALSQAQSAQNKLVTDAPNHMSASPEFSLVLNERKSTHVSLDGNTVDKDREIIDFSRNALNYQASLSFLDNKIKSMMLALRGE